MYPGNLKRIVHCAMNFIAMRLCIPSTQRDSYVKFYCASATYKSNKKTLSFPLMFNELEIKLGKQYPRCIKFDLNRSNNIFPYLELIHNLFLHTVQQLSSTFNNQTDANNGQLDRHILWEFGPCRMLLKRQPRGARCFGIWFFYLQSLTFTFSNELLKLG